MSVNSTNYTKTSTNSTGFGVKSPSPYVLLLQNGDNLLLQDDVTSILLELGEIGTVNYTKQSTNATNYS